MDVVQHQKLVGDVGVLVGSARIERNGKQRAGGQKRPRGGDDELEPVTLSGAGLPEKVGPSHERNPGHKIGRSLP